MLRKMFNGFFKRPPVSKINLKSLPHLKYDEPYEQVSKQLTREITTHGPDKVIESLRIEAKLLEWVEAELVKKKQQFDEKIGEPSLKRAIKGYSLEGYKAEERANFAKRLKELQEVKDGLKSRQIESEKLLPQRLGFFSRWSSAAKRNTETPLTCSSKLKS